MRKRSFNLGWTFTTGSFWNRTTPKKVDLPHDYIVGMERSPENPGGGFVGFFPSEEAEYKKELMLPEGFSGRLLLNMDGAYEKTEVYVDHNLVFQHPYGYTGTVCDLSRFVHPGSQVLRVTMSSRHPASRWYTGGGLYREVALFESGMLSIEPWDVFLTTPVVSAEKATVRALVTVTDLKREVTRGTVDMTIFTKDGRRVSSAHTEVMLSAGKNEVLLECEVDSPALWSIDTPELYKVIVTASDEEETDEWEGSLGIRCIEMDAKNGLRLNGEKLKLYGGCLHHDNGFLGAAAIPDAEERKVRKMKEAGFNAIRTAHNPPSTALLDACDRLGMLVLVESFDCWRVGKTSMDYHQQFEKWWDYDTTCMVKRDRNHPSVFAWSIGNEIMEFDGASDGVYWGKVQADLVRQLDPTRPVTSGINMACGRPQDHFKGMSYNEMAYEMAHSTGIYNGEDRWGRATEGNIANLDIAGYNYMYERYKEDAIRYPDRVILGTETMPFYVTENYRAVMENDNVIGDFIWVAVDNLGEAGMGAITWGFEPPEGGMFHSGWPWMSCHQGDLDMTCFRRPISYYRSVVWGMDHKVHLYVRHPEFTGMNLYGSGWHWEDVDPNWSFGEEWIGKPVDIVAYADADEVEFVLDGRSIGRVIPTECQARITADYAPGVLKAIAYKNGEILAEDVIESAGNAVRIEAAVERETLPADGMSLSYIRAELKDENGHPVFGDDRMVKVTVEGEGTLQGLGSGRPCTEESFGTGAYTTYKSAVTAAVRSTVNAGEIRVRFESEGLMSCEVVLKAE